MVKGNQQKILDAFYDLAMQNPDEVNLSMSASPRKLAFHAKQFINIISIMLTILLNQFMRTLINLFTRLF